VAKGNISLGFSLFPTVRIANRNVQEVKLLDTELLQSNQQVLESALGSLVEAKNQFDLASQAEAALKIAWQNKVTQYELGTATLTDVLFARIQMAESQVARIKATMGLNLQRTVVNRALVLDQFAQIKGCDMANVPDHHGSASLDQLCREAAASEH
jgi:outer membrane protein TolC